MATEGTANRHITNYEELIDLAYDVMAGDDDQPVSVEVPGGRICITKTSGGICPMLGTCPEGMITCDGQKGTPTVRFTIILSDGSTHESLAYPFSRFELEDSASPQSVISTIAKPHQFKGRRTPDTLMAMLSSLLHFTVEVEEEGKGTDGKPIIRHDIQLPPPPSHTPVTKIIRKSSTGIHRNVFGSGQDT